MTLLRIEIERSLRRRSVWVLVAIALVGAAVLGLVSFLSSTGATDAELLRDAHPASMRTWWMDSRDDGALLVGAVFLLMGGLIGGAVVVGGEWRSGSVATTLTWEPRRVRLLVTRLVAMAIDAFAIAVALQAVLLVALLPAVLVHGTTSGADAAWAVSLGAAIGRIAIATALAAVFAGCVASIGRTSAAAIVTVWVWLALVEPILRARKPWMGRYLLAENVATVVSWSRIDGAAGPRPLAAVLTLTLVTAAIVLVAARVFRRADIIAG
jgi:ABC-2 type transport system permease protein